MTPRASVLLPVRDAAPFLAEALASLLAETGGPPFEVVAVDDGSSDGSGGILREAALGDPRLRAVRTEGVGLVAALNLALAAARAELVVRMDADDRSLPGRLAALVARLEERADLALVGSDVALHPEGAQGRGMLRYVSWLNAVREDDLPREMWVESPLAHPAIAARRSVLLAAGGYREGPFPEDYDLLLRLHRQGHRLGKVSRVLYWWRDHPARLTRRHPRYGPAAFRALKARHLHEGPLNGLREVAIWGAGKTGRPLAAALGREGLSVAAWIDVDPRKVGRRLHGAPVLPVEEVGSLRGTPILVAVGAEGARPLIRRELDRRGFVELADYWVCA
jgi:GT2 family glycosyltransferase